MIDLRPGHFRLMSLKNGNTWNVQRRPLLPFSLPSVSQCVAVILCNFDVHVSFMPVFILVHLVSLYCVLGIIIIIIIIIIWVH